MIVIVAGKTVKGPVTVDIKNVPDEAQRPECSETV